jgi:hypothetical protein
MINRPFPAERKVGFDGLVLVCQAAFVLPASNVVQLDAELPSEGKHLVGLDAEPGGDLVSLDHLEVSAGALCSEMELLSGF